MKAAFSEKKASLGGIGKILLGIAVAAAAFYFSQRQQLPPEAEVMAPPPKPEPPKTGRDLLVEDVRNLLALPEGLDRQERLLAWLDSLERKDFPTALRLIRFDQSALQGLLLRWAELDPSGLERELSAGGFPLEFDQWGIANTLWDTWAQRDPDVALERAQKATLTPGMEDAPWAVISSVLSRDLEKAKSLIAKAPAAHAGFGFDPALYKIDPGALVQAVTPEGRKIDRFLGDALRPVIAAWAEKAPAKLLEWLRTQSPENLQPILRAAMDHLGSHDAKAALELVAKLPTAADRDEAGWLLAVSWAKKEPAAALTWAVQNLRKRKLAALDEYAKNLPLEGAGPLVAQISAELQGEARREVLPHLAYHLVTIDPVAGSQWLQSLPNDEAKIAVLQRVGTIWAEAYPEEARKYFLTAPPGPEMDAVIRAVVSTTADRDLTGALRMARQLRGERGQTALRTVFTRAAHAFDFPTAANMFSSLTTAEEKAAALEAYIQPFASGELEIRIGKESFVSFDESMKAKARAMFAESPELAEVDKKEALEALK